jgi:hypothetical protein
VDSEGSSAVDRSSSGILGASAGESAHGQCILTAACLAVNAAAMTRNFDDHKFDYTARNKKHTKRLSKYRLPNDSTKNHISNLCFKGMKKEPFVTDTGSQSVTLETLYGAVSVVSHVAVRVIF